MGTVLLNNGQHIDFESVNNKGYLVKVYYSADDDPMPEYMTKTQLTKVIKEMLKTFKDRKRGR